MTKTFKETIEWANARGVGQFHVFDSAGHYHSTWRALASAQRVARNEQGRVHNDSGDDVTNA